VIRNWKRRLFVLSHTGLKYYSDVTKKDFKGEVDISNIREIRPPTAPGETLFELRTIRGKDFRLRADTNADAIQWAKEIHAVRVAPSPHLKLQMQVQQAETAGTLREEVRSAGRGALPCNAVPAVVSATCGVVPAAVAHCSCCHCASLVAGPRAHHGLAEDRRPGAPGGSPAAVQLVVVVNTGWYVVRVLKTGRLPCSPFLFSMPPTRPSNVACFSRHRL
jgi:hypothetical protein